MLVTTQATGDSIFIRHIDGRLIVTIQLVGRGRVAPPPATEAEQEAAETKRWTDHQGKALAKFFEQEG